MHYKELHLLVLYLFGLPVILRGLDQAVTDDTIDVSVELHVALLKVFMMFVIF